MGVNPCILVFCCEGETLQFQIRLSGMLVISSQLGFITFMSIKRPPTRRLSSQWSARSLRFASNQYAGCQMDVSRKQQGKVISLLQLGVGGYSFSHTSRLCAESSSIQKRLKSFFLIITSCALRSRSTKGQLYIQRPSTIRCNWMYSNTWAQVSC